MKILFVRSTCVGSSSLFEVKTTDWKAVCGRIASTVWRGEGSRRNRFLLPYHGRRPARGRRRSLGDRSHTDDASLAIEDTGEGTSATQKMPPRVPGRSLWDQSDTEEGLLAVGDAAGGYDRWHPKMLILLSASPEAIEVLRKDGRLLPTLRCNGYSTNLEYEAYRSGVDRSCC